MKALIALALLLPVSALAETKFQCAGNNVRNGGVRVNVMKTKGKWRANLIFGTTVSGTMYVMKKNGNVYEGIARGDSDYRMILTLSEQTEENANIMGVAARLRVTYPDLDFPGVRSTKNVALVCGEKISDRWN